MTHFELCRQAGTQASGVMEDLLPDGVDYMIIVFPRRVDPETGREGFIVDSNMMTPQVVSEIQGMAIMSATEKPLKEEVSVITKTLPPQYPLPKLPRPSAN